MKKTECSIELNVHELDIILKSLELVESIDEIQINRSSIPWRPEFFDF